MRPWLLWKIIGLSTLAMLAATIAIVFPLHDRLYAWPLWAVAGFVFLWLVALAFAINYIFAPIPIDTEEEET
jgi:type IV secretory pathway component VirB8